MLAVRLRWIIEASMYKTGVKIRLVPHSNIAKYRPIESGTPSTDLFINTSAAA